MSATDACCKVDEHGEGQAVSDGCRSCHRKASKETKQHGPYKLGNHGQKADIVPLVFDHTECISSVSCGFCHCTELATWVIITALSVVL